jgi:membrane protein DedA with SNARE-associated domain
MTETLLALVPVWGVVLVLVSTYVSCLAIPVPTSVIMLGAGGFVASGDLSLAGVALGALGGAVAGDQTGYRIGRALGSGFLDRMRGHRRTGKTVEGALAILDQRGGTGVFLSRWLFSPLGPYVNFAAGAAEFPWKRFTLAGIAGEAVWVTIYVGLGYGFAGDIVELAGLLGNVSGFLAGLALLGGIGWWLARALRQRTRQRGARATG